MDQGSAQTNDDRRPVDRRANIQYWIRWIAGAKKAAKSSWLDAEEAWREYEAGKGDQLENVPDDQYGSYAGYGSGWLRRYPLYWTCTQILESAFYSKSPKLVVKRRFDIEDPVALTGSLILERLSAYLMEGASFDSTMRAAVGDLIHASKTTTQLIYNVTYKPLPAIPVTQENSAIEPEGAGKEITEQGEAAPYSADGQIEPLAMDAGAMPEPEVATQEIKIIPICYDEIIHTPDAKTQDEITEIGYHFCMDYDAARERFLRNPDGTYKQITLPWKTSKSYDRDQNEQTRVDIPGKYLQGWEIYCLKTKRVYWVCEDYPEAFLDDKPDPYGLKNFFPSPKFVITNKPAKSLYPRPTYSRLRPTLEKLHELYGRKFDLIEGIRRRALVDGAEEDLIATLNSAESGEFIAVKTLQSIIDKGGIANLVLWIPIQELVNAIGEINSLEEEFKSNVNEWFGMPDIIRGISDPQEALGSQEIKTAEAHNRFRNVKKQFEEMIRESIEIMLDLALQVFSDQKIAEIVGYQFLSPDHQGRFIPALQMLRNDSMRTIRIDIETGSTSFVDSQMELSQRKMVADTINAGLAQINAIENPKERKIGFRLLLSTLSGLGGTGSQQFEDEIKSIYQEMLKVSNEPPPPPPPDYEQMKLQLLGQKQEIELAVKQRELDQKEVQIFNEQMTAKYDQELETIKTQMAQQETEFRQMIDAQYLRLDEYKVVLDEREKLIEEQRLALEAATAAQELPKLPETPAPPQIIQVTSPPMPPINLTIESPKGRRTQRIVRDELGQIAALEIDDAAPEIVPLVP